MALFILAHNSEKKVHNLLEKLKHSKYLLQQTFTNNNEIVIFVIDLPLVTEKLK